MHVTLYQSLPELILNDIYFIIEISKVFKVLKNHQPGTLSLKICMRRHFKIKFGMQNGLEHITFQYIVMFI